MSKKISELTSLPSSPTTGDLVEVVRSGVNYKADASGFGGSTTGIPGNLLKASILSTDSGATSGTAQFTLNGNELILKRTGTSGQAIIANPIAAGFVRGGVYKITGFIESLHEAASSGPWNAQLLFGLSAGTPPASGSFIPASAQNSTDGYSVPIYISGIYALPDVDLSGTHIGIDVFNNYYATTVRIVSIEYVGRSTSSTTGDAVITAP